MLFSEFSSFPYWNPLGKITVDTTTFKPLEKYMEILNKLSICWTNFIEREKRNRRNEILEIEKEISKESSSKK